MGRPHTASLWRLTRRPRFSSNSQARRRAASTHREVHREVHEEEARLVLRMIGVALRRPWIIPHALGAAWAMRARDWYVRPPFLPLPPRAYVDWRMETAYGSAHANPPADDLARYLVWSTRMRRLMRRAPHD